MSKLLKDQVDREFISGLIENISLYSKDFKKNAFTSNLFEDLNWKNLELKERVRAIVQAIGEHLKGEYYEQINILKKIIPHSKGLGTLLFPDFIEVYGLNHWEISIPALKYFTPFFSSEFAVRKFIVQDKDRMMATMFEWSKDDNYHVRRLSSEGCRPRLPWANKLHDFIKDPSPILPILENLKSDPELYVRRSVANNLNDISKDHPDLVLQLAKKWVGSDPNVDWIVKHALRTLLKKGNQQALAIFGLRAPKDIEIKKLFLANPSFKIGSRLDFNFEIVNNSSSNQKIRVEYAIHYLKKNGSYSKKIFKMSEQSMGAKSIKTIIKYHSLRQMTTRTHYVGKHYLEIVINGMSLSKMHFFIE